MTDSLMTKLPKGWVNVQVSDVCHLIDYGLTTSADFSCFEPKFLRITDIQNGEVIWSKVPGCLVAHEDESQKQLKTGDIVFARTGGTVGKSFLIQNPPSRAVFASYLIRLQPNNTKVLPEFLYMFFQSPAYWWQISTSERGGAQPNVNSKLLGNISFPMPTELAEQKRIVAILTQKLATIAKARAAAEAQLAAAQALPAAYLRQIFESEEAQAWPIRKLGEVCNFIGGSQPPKSTFKYEPQPGYVRLVQIQDFRLNDVAVYIPADLANRSFEKDDVMIGRYGPPVFQILRGLSGAYNVALMKAEPKADMTKAFLFYLLQEPALQREVTEQSQRSAGQSGVNRQFLESYKMRIPPKALQLELAARVDKQLAAAEKTIALLNRQIEPLNSLAAAVLRQAFNGEL